MMKLSLDKVYTAKETAEKLGYTNITSLYNAVYLGRIPKPEKFNNTLLFLKRDIDKIAKGRK